MKIEDHQIMQVATVRGKENVVLWKDDDDVDGDGDYNFIADDGYVLCVDPGHVCDIQNAIVIPLPEVVEVTTSAAWGDQVELRADERQWSYDHANSSLEETARTGIAAMAVLLSRKAKREAVPDLTDDLRRILECASMTVDRVRNVTNDENVRGIRDAVSRVARLVNGGAKLIQEPKP